MTIKSLWLTLMALAACVPCSAQEPASQPLQQYSVLRSSRLVTASETLRNADANCSIAGTGRDATMQCNSAGGTAKASYHFNTALVLDGRGMAYVIACRLSLVAWWCKTLPPGAVLRGNFANGHIALSDGQKIHDYDVVISKYVGAASPVQQTPSEQAPAAGAQATSENSKSAVGAATGAKTPEGLTSNQAASDQAACKSPNNACVAFVSEPPGADVYVDNKFVGNTPSTLPLVPGSHEIRVEARSLKPWTRTFDAIAGSTITIRATLEPAPREK